MASEKVLSDEILQDARKKTDRAQKRAEREAKKILDDAAKAAQAATKKTLDAAQRRADRMSQSVLATLGQEVRRDLLDAQQAELDKLFEAARARLADCGAYDYPAVLAGLAAEAVAKMHADQVVFEFREADRAIATPEWLERVRQAAGREVTLTVSEHQAPIENAGVIARSADGKLLYDNSFAARLERLRPELRKELAARVYGGEKEDTGGTPVPPGREEGKAEAPGS